MGSFTEETDEICHLKGGVFFSYYSSVRAKWIWLYDLQYDIGNNSVLMSSKYLFLPLPACYTKQSKFSMAIL